MQETNKEQAWKNFEQTGAIGSYLSYRGVNPQPHANAEKKEAAAEKPVPQNGGFSG